jgi:ribosomal protein S18 acetylase RimI-like enzyme
MSESPETRIAGSADAPEAARLLDAFNREYDEDTPGVEILTARCRELIEAGEAVVVLAAEPDAGIGVIRFRRSLWTESPTALDAYLEELYVVPRRRGEGIGRALLQRAMDASRERGAVRIELGTSTDDHAAIGLYESAGFTNLEGEGGPSMLVYERELPGGGS